LAQRPGFLWIWRQTIPGSPLRTQNSVRGPDHIMCVHSAAIRTMMQWRFAGGVAAVDERLAPRYGIAR
jgi:hypothetical protein